MIHTLIQTKCGDLNFVEVLKVMKNPEGVLNAETARGGPQIIAEGETNNDIWSMK